MYLSFTVKYEILLFSTCDVLLSEFYIITYLSVKSLTYGSSCLPVHSNQFKGFPRKHSKINCMKNFCVDCFIASDSQIYLIREVMSLIHNLYSYNTNSMFQID
jgi:hypothetical protein